MGTLYECLKEARLEKYYPTFRANGISRSDTLARLTVEECSAMGVTSLDDKRRLSELIDIVRSVHFGPPVRNISTPSRSQSRSFRSSRNDHPQTPSRPSDSRDGRQYSGRGLEITRDVTVRDRTPNYSSASYLDLIDILTDTTSEESTEESMSDDEPQAKQPARPRPGRNPTERVKHDSGYNYGVPKTKVMKRHKSSSKHGEDRIRVCVRKRPVMKRELKASDKDIVDAESTTTLSVNEPKVAVDLKPYLLQHEFRFDEVFDENCTNDDVYVRATRPLISCLFEGGSATCFAYGQTGAGKTHTMMGNKDTPGLYLLAANDIFSLIQSGKYGRGLHVWVSFFEIYCGQLFDLLNKRNRLHPREDGSHRVCIAGLTETEAVDSKVLVEVLEYGNSVRSKGATGVNPDSSRSHAILQMEIRDDNDHRNGRISFIDLAGSERAADVTDTDKQTRLEGAEINQSLLALKECIRSIDQDSRHTPFRQSKLTHILKDSFVGNSKTCMIANISPTQTACENTLNTLRYADRVKELRRDSKNTNISQTMNLLMNIPITTATVFNPSNVLASSTPMKSQQTSRHTPHRHSDTVESSDTPARGNTPHRKLVKGHSSKKKPTSPARTSTSRSVASRLADIPRKLKEAASRSAPSPRQSLAGASASYSIATNVPSGASASHGSALMSAAVKTSASASESDHTDTDSNNVNVPKSGEFAVSNFAVVRSTDTDVDFPTSDFNNVEEELNDLNRNGKNLKAKDASFVPAQAWGAAEIQEPKSSYFPDTNMFQNVPPQSIDLNQQLDVPGPKDQNPRADVVFEPGYFLQSDQVRPKTNFTNNRSQSSSQPLVTRPFIPSALKESFEDDLLFGQPSDQAFQRASQLKQESFGFPQPYVWGSSLGDGSSHEPLVQTPRNGNGTLNQLSNIPAVLPAQSSDLTTFSQRSPLKADTNKVTHPRVVDSPPKSRSLSPKSRTPPLSPGARPKSPKIRIKKADSLPSSSPIPKSPTHSDDSIEGVRMSHSDQGQGPYQNVRSASLRKGKSDPMLALHIQNKKQTAPDPGDYSKYLSRGGAQRSNPSPTPFSANQSPRRKYSDEQVLTDYQKDIESRRTQSDESLSSSVKTGSLPDSKTSKQSNLHRSSSLKSHHVSDSTKNHSPSIITKEHFNTDSISLRSQTELLKPVTSVTQSRTDTLQSKTEEPVNRSHMSVADSVLVQTGTSTAVSIFSPIHPQPLTSKGVSQSVTTETVSQNVVQPKPMSSRPWESVNLTRPSAESTDTRTRLISAHEDQLTKVTSFCKQEMKLLLTAKKSGQKNFEEYLKRLNDLLGHKMATIQLLQENINTYFIESQLPR